MDKADESRRLMGMRHGVEKRRPTLRHRPVLTLGMLGTVYGISPAGEVRYFDYHWGNALLFAEVDAIRPEEFREIDLRFGSPRNTVWLPGHDMWHPERKIHPTEKAYWVKDGKDQNSGT